LPSAKVRAPIVIVADPDLVVSVTEVAVTVTVPPAGVTKGAVNVSAVPLADELELRLPQTVLVPQVTVQVTPAFAVSLVTVAVTACWLPATAELGPLTETVIDAGGGLVGPMLVVEPPPQATKPLMTARPRVKKID
jgi:hypothetical protein